MNISTLEAYVESKNQWNAIFKVPAMSLLNAQDRRKIAEAIDCDLSPENLSCDGEAPRSQVQARYKMLTRAAQELISIDPSVIIPEYE